MPDEVFFRVKDLVKRFEGFAAVNGTSFDIERGSITALIGPNGAGKTTVFNLISSFLTLDEGSIEFQGRPIGNLKPHDISRAGIGRTFQTTRVLHKMSVIDNVRVASMGHPGERLRWAMLRTKRTRQFERDVDQRAHEMLELVGLTAMADEYAATLSGGQRKLLEFARVMMQQPQMVLLDEPTAGVLPTLGETLIGHVKAQRAAHGTTFMIIEHNMDVVMSASDRVIVMNEGAVIADGAPSEVQANEEVIDAYLGTYHDASASGTSDQPEAAPSEPS
jgi:ABC-type branched-subunit amino acid transport system ATPase component